MHEKEPVRKASDFGQAVVSSHPPVLMLKHIWWQLTNGAFGLTENREILPNGDFGGFWYYVA